MRQLGKALTVNFDYELSRDFFGVVKPLFFTGGCAFLCVFWMVFCGGNVVT
jgi:hypothetical protein